MASRLYRRMPVTLGSNEFPEFAAATNPTTSPAPGTSVTTAPAGPQIEVTPITLPTPTIQVTTAPAPAAAPALVCPAVWPWWWCAVAALAGAGAGVWIAQDAAKKRKNAARVGRRVAHRIVNAGVRRAMRR